jgi:acyl carrier protein
VSNLNKVKELMALIFEVDRDLIDDASSVDSISTWDSVAQLKLVIGLEQEFGVVIAEEDVVNMSSMEMVLAVLRDLDVEV